eukprot:Sspe_Gene.19985::Locus_7307_Transcript_1_1_Confidence_1.000_Length_7185::g.19985::m.19985
MARQAGAELQYGDRISLGAVLTDGHLSASFVNGRCYPIVAVHPTHTFESGRVALPVAFEQCVFTVLRPTDETGPGEGVTSRGVPSVTYGACVRLAAESAGQLLSVDMRGNSVDDDDEECSPAVCFVPRREDGAAPSLEETFRILPRGKVREEGEAVRVGEQVLIEAVAASACLAAGSLFPKALFFDSAKSAAIRATEGRAVELSTTAGSEAVWAVEPYELRSANDYSNTGGSILRAGDAIVLFHKEREAFLEGTSDHSVVFAPVRPPKATYSVRDLDQPSGAVWIVESAAITRGGAVVTYSWGGEAAYRLRHLATGRYLRCSGPSAFTGSSPSSGRNVKHLSLRPRLSLVQSLAAKGDDGSEGSIEETLVAFHPLDDSDDAMRAGGYARVELAGGGAWLHCSSDFKSNGDTGQGDGLGGSVDLGRKLVAGVAPRPLYEDLFAIHPADIHIAPAMARIVSIIPLLRAAAEMLGEPSTFAIWNEVSSDAMEDADKDPNIRLPDGVEGTLLLAAMQAVITPTTSRENLSLPVSSIRPVTAALAVLAITQAQFRSGASPSTSSIRNTSPLPSPRISLTSPTLGGRQGSQVRRVMVHENDNRIPKGPLPGPPIWLMGGDRVGKRYDVQTTPFHIQPTPCVGAGPVVTAAVQSLRRAAWLGSLRRLLGDATAALATLISFVNDSPPPSQCDSRRPHMPISPARAIAAANTTFALRTPPVRSRQLLLYEQGIHHLVYRILAAPFERGKLALESVGTHKYESLHVLLRLGYRLIMQMVAGCGETASHVAQYIRFFETQSGHRLNATDTIHAIIHDHRAVLNSLTDQTIKNFVDFVPRFGRSPSYLNLLSALCVCCGEGILRSQKLVCDRVFQLQQEGERDKSASKELLHKTRLHNGELEVDLLANETDSGASRECSDYQAAAVTPGAGSPMGSRTGSPMGSPLGSMKQGGTLTVSEMWGRRWVPLSCFVAHGTYSTVKYFERQLHLLASLCADNAECSARVAALVPRDHILAALEGSQVAPTDAGLGDAVRTCYLALMRVLYLQPAATSKRGAGEDPDLLTRSKKLLFIDIERNTSLSLPRVRRNQQVCETLRCLLLLAVNGRMDTRELCQIAPVLCQLLDPGSDTLNEIGTHPPLPSGAARMVGHYYGSFRTNNSAIPWQRAVCSAISPDGPNDPKFTDTEANKVIMNCKLEACQLLDAANRFGAAFCEWVDAGLSIDVPGRGPLHGRHALVKVLLEVTMYRGNPKLFSAAFRLLCRCLTETEGNDYILPPQHPPQPLTPAATESIASFVEEEFAPISDTEEHPAVIAFAEILKHDVNGAPSHMAARQAESGVLVQHFVNHFMNKPEADVKSVCIMLRVLRELISSEKRRGGERAMSAMQNRLDDLGCTLLMSNLIEANVEAIVEQSLIFGIALLEEGNIQVQQRLMSYFDSLNDEAFFQCIRGRLHRAIQELKDIEMREKRRALEAPTPAFPLMGAAAAAAFPFGRPSAGGTPKVTIDSNLCHVKNTLRLLQLFCEGHNHELQSYIHAQPDNLHSVDLVKESFMVLKAVLGVPLSCFEQTLFELVLQCFNSLTEYCQGPCKENQAALVNAHVAREVSTVLSTDYEQASHGRISREQTDEVQNAATITLLSLLEGCEDRQVPATLMQTVDLALIGAALDQCWGNRKRTSGGEKDSALELGFNLFIFMETLSAFDGQHFLVDHNYFMTSEAGFTYFHAMTGRIEIARDAHLQRVYFRIPELCLNLSETTRQSILWAVDRDTPSSRISSFFSMADDALFEMRFNDRHFSEKALCQGKADALSAPLLRTRIAGVLAMFAVHVHRRSKEIGVATVFVAVVISVINAVVLATDPYGPVERAVLNFLGCVQLVLTVAGAIHQAVAHGPILAHKKVKEEQKGRWAKLHSRLPPEALLALRRQDDSVSAGQSKMQNKFLPQKSPGAHQRRKSHSSPRKFDVRRESPNVPSHGNTPHGNTQILSQQGGRKSVGSLTQRNLDNLSLRSPLIQGLGNGRKLKTPPDDGLLMSSKSLGSLGDSFNRLPKARPSWDDGPKSQSSSDDDIKSLKETKKLLWRRRSLTGRPPALLDTAPSSAVPGSPSQKWQQRNMDEMSISTDSQSDDVSIPPDSPLDMGEYLRPHQLMRMNSFMKPFSPSRARQVPQGGPVKGSTAPPILSPAMGDNDDGTELGAMTVLSCILHDSTFIGQSFMVVCSILGLSLSPLFFTSQLFTIVSNSPILQSVIRSITKNGRSLLLTGLLAVIIVYHFAVAGFVFFRDSYKDSGEAAASLFRTFVHTLFNGIASGGIADLMTPPEFDADGDGSLDIMYGLRMGFDFSFFVIVIVILLNIIFGIIIDTFAEL